MTSSVRRASLPARALLRLGGGLGAGVGSGTCAGPGGSDGSGVGSGTGTGCGSGLGSGNGSGDGAGGSIWVGCTWSCARWIRSIASAAVRSISSSFALTSPSSSAIRSRAVFGPFLVVSVHRFAEHAGGFGPLRQ